jgi:hypothetical protein
VNATGWSRGRMPLFHLREPTAQDEFHLGQERPCRPSYLSGYTALCRTVPFCPWVSVGSAPYRAVPGAAPRVHLAAPALVPGNSHRTRQGRGGRCAAWPTGSRPRPGHCTRHGAPSADHCSLLASLPGLGSALQWPITCWVWVPGRAGGRARAARRTGERRAQQSRRRGRQLRDGRQLFGGQGPGADPGLLDERAVGIRDGRPDRAAPPDGNSMSGDVNSANCSTVSVTR